MVLGRQLKKYARKIVQGVIRILRLDALMKKIGYFNTGKFSDHHYVLDYYGKSASKQVDIRSLPGFGALATKVIEQGRIYLYYDRLFTIFQALGNFKGSADTINFVEVGVFQGGTSYFIAAMSNSIGKGMAMFLFHSQRKHKAR